MSPRAITVISLWANQGLSSKKAIINRHPIRAEELDKQLSALLFRYAMPASWADKLRELIDKDEASEKADFVHRVAGDKETIARLSEKNAAITR